MQDYMIQTSQQAVSKNLEKIVEKHRFSAYQRPIADQQKNIFTEVNRVMLANKKPVILDACCGTGLSTFNLAERYPAHWVIGVDKSAHRLRKGAAYARDNLLLVQANVIDFWRLAVAADWQIEKHCLFYPNPYPKASDFTKRWHGHPVFPDLLKLGKMIEVRSNWKIYLDEFARAASLSGGEVRCFEEVAPNGSPMTLFEKKYFAAKVPVYRLLLSL